MKNVLRAIVKFIAKILIFIVYRPKIVGKENLPKDTSAIICPNHVHSFDSVTIVVTTKRKMHILAKEIFFKNIFFRGFANLFDIHPVKEGKKSLESMKISLKILKEGQMLLIFPEGTRNGLAKGVQPKDGAIKLAIKSKTPIIPVGIQGNFKFFRKIKINIGKPIDYSIYQNDITNKETLEKLTDELMNTIIKLRDEKI